MCDAARCAEYSQSSVALATLAGDGAIRNLRGVVTIRDRHKLEDLAGGAYSPLHSRSNTSRAD